VNVQPHVLAGGHPAPSAVCMSIGAPRADAPPPSTAAGELGDDDLEHVVGGLARVWVDHALAAPASYGAYGRLHA
jgi:hypothetical protein